MNQSLLLNDVLTGAASMVVTSFVMGMRYGQMRALLMSIDKRLAVIEGMFRLVPKGVSFREVKDDGKEE